MRVLNPKEIQAVSGGATSGSLPPPLDSIRSLLLGFFALLTGGNFLKYWY